MNPDAQTLWRAPRWTLAALLACLGMLGPFSIDTYLPAFSGIAQSIDATPVQMQQTLSAYLFGFALMNLFHGALSDSFGRRPVVLWGFALWALNWRMLPETLHATQVQSFHPAHLLRGYWQMVSSPRFLLLAFASGVPFNGMFLYVLSAPVFLGELLHLPPERFFWFFLLTITGIMGGAWFSGRLAGRITPQRQIRH